MQSQKLDAELNLALDISNAEREKSQNLQVGYNENTREWDLIIRYVGNIDFLSERYGARVQELLNGYAVITIGEDYIDELITYEEIIYVEKPNNVYVNVEEAISASCINRLTLPDIGLTGEGVIVAVIDSGIDYAHPDFRNEDGTTRILELWDQSGTEGAPPEGYRIGTLYSAEQINEALGKLRIPEQLSIVPEVDISGHGTFVAGVAAGNGRASNGQNRGVAWKSDLLVVKLGNTRKEGFPRTTELMQAVDYVVRYAVRVKRPVSINLSFGNNYGSHDGQSLLETYINSAVDSALANICIGSGNDGDSGKHTSVQLMGNIAASVPFSVSPNEKAFNIQIWKNYVDVFNISLMAPDNSMLGPFPSILGVQQYSVLGTLINVYYDFPKPYQLAQQIYIDFIPKTDYVSSGEWRIVLTPENIIDGKCDLWLPVSGTGNPDTRFLIPTPDGSLTIPSTSANAVTVGAYNSRTDALASFSGRGYTRIGDIKPDLVAPGVDILSCSPGGGYTIKSGTSIATPFVTGTVALMMEWGIIRGNDAYLYGEKAKAYLQRGARRLRGYAQFPNPQVGYGALCAAESIP